MVFLWQKFWKGGSRFLHMVGEEGMDYPYTQGEESLQTNVNEEPEDFEEFVEQETEQVRIAKESLNADYQRLIDTLTTFQGEGIEGLDDNIASLQQAQQEIDNWPDGNDATEINSCYQGVLDKAIARTNDEILPDLGIEAEDQIDQITKKLEDGDFPPRVVTEVTQMLDYARTSSYQATSFKQYLQIFNDLNLAKSMMAPPPEPQPQVPEANAEVPEELKVEEQSVPHPTENPKNASGADESTESPAEEESGEESSDEAAESTNEVIDTPGEYPPHIVEQHKSAQELLVQLKAGEAPSSSYNGGDVMKPGRLNSLSITDHSGYTIGMSLEQPESSDHANLVLDYTNATYTQNFLTIGDFSKVYPKLAKDLPEAGGSATLEESMTLPSGKPAPFGGATRSKTLEVSVSDNGEITVNVKNIRFNGDARLAIPLQKTLAELQESGTADDILYPDGYKPNDPSEIKRLGSGIGPGAVLDAGAGEGEVEEEAETEKTPEQRIAEAENRFNKYADIYFNKSIDSNKSSESAITELQDMPEFLQRRFPTSECKREVEYLRNMFYNNKSALANPDVFGEVQASLDRLERYTSQMKNFNEVVSDYDNFQNNGVEYSADQKTDTFADHFGAAGETLEAAGITMNGITIKPVKPYKNHAMRLRFDGTFDSDGEARNLKANVLIAKGENWEKSVGKAIDRIVKKKGRVERRIDDNKARQAEINNEDWDGPEDPMTPRYEHSGGDEPLAIPVGEEHLATGDSPAEKTGGKADRSLDAFIDAFDTKGPRGKNAETPAEDQPVEVDEDAGPDLKAGMDDAA